MILEEEVKSEKKEKSEKYKNVSMPQFIWNVPNYNHIFYQQNSSEGNFPTINLITNAKCINKINTQTA